MATYPLKRKSDSKNPNRLRGHHNQDPQSSPPRAPHLSLLSHNDLQSRESPASLPFQPPPRLHQHEQIPNRFYPSTKLLLHPSQRQRHLRCMARQRICLQINDHIHPHRQRNSKNCHPAPRPRLRRYPAPRPTVAVITIRRARQVPRKKQRHPRCHGRRGSRPGHTFGGRGPQLRPPPQFGDLYTQSWPDGAGGEERTCDQYGDSVRSRNMAADRSGVGEEAGGVQDG